MSRGLFVDMKPNVFWPSPLDQFFICKTKIWKFVYIPDLPSFWLFFGKKIKVLILWANLRFSFIWNSLGHTVLVLNQSTSTCPWSTYLVNHFWISQSSTQTCFESLFWTDSKDFQLTFVLVQSHEKCPRWIHNWNVWKLVFW